MRFVRRMNTDKQAKVSYEIKCTSSISRSNAGLLILWHILTHTGGGISR